LRARVTRDRLGELAAPEVEQSPVLPLADEPHVVDAVGVALDVPEHHRRARVHAERVRDIHRRQPRLGGALAEPDLVADRGREDLAAAARQAVEPRLLQADHDPADLLFEVGAGRVEEVDELDELGRAEAVDVDAPGSAAFISPSRSRYQSSGSSGFIPPCIRICVPPIARSSATFSKSCSFSSVYASWSVASRRNAQKVHLAVHTLV
jgi:hypothetical protein